MKINYAILLPMIPLAALLAMADERDLYIDSIQATKQSIARDTLDAFYHDAMEYYNDRRYDDALQLLDKIYSIDPRYENVASLRASIRKTQENKVSEQSLDSAKDWMKKG